MIKEWKTLPYAINYDVSNYGEVKQNKKNKMLKPYINKKNGYAYVFIRDNNGKYLNKRIHRLVAEMFIPNPNNYDEVNHIDGNTKNNALTNLEWCSHKMNVKHATQIIKVFDNYGKHTTNLRKEVAQIDMKTNEVIAVYKSVREAEKQTGIKSPYICNCANGKQKYAKGYRWCYVEVEE